MRHGCRGEPLGHAPGPRVCLSPTGRAGLVSRAVETVAVGIAVLVCTRAAELAQSPPRSRLERAGVRTEARPVQCVRQVTPYHGPEPGLTHRGAPVAVRITLPQDLWVHNGHVLWSECLCAPKFIR